MSTQSEFLQQIRDILNHLYDYSYLESHPLALQYWPEIGRRGPGRAQRLHRLLLESIEELNPPDAPSKDTSRARFYSLLVYRYVEEWALPDIMRELGYSRSQFFRDQRKAIAMLASLLRQKLPVPSSTEPDDLLAAETERFLIQREAIHPVEMAQGVLEVVGHLAEQHSVTLECDLDPRVPSVYSNRTLLRQVFLTALSNLITRAGTQRVCLWLRYEGQMVIVELIAEDDTPSRRPDDTVDDRVPDLDSLRRLVEMVGGHWRGYEAGPEGCTCRFDLPTESKKVLLVVEDNEAVIRAFRRYLAGYDYQVIGATTGAEALQLAREASPAAITLDVMMPSQDGWEILQALKNDPVTQHIPVLICSVLEDPELARSLGAVAYLRKPVAQADLVSALGGLSSTA